MSILILLHLM